MKKKMKLPANSFSVMIGMAFYFLIAYILIACNPADTGNPKEPIRNWITLDIRFKLNTNAEMRDLAIRTVEKVLIDSFMVSTFPIDSSYHPIISISKSPSTDTLRYFLNIGPDSNSSKIQTFPLPAQEPTDRPPCKCSTGCGVCNIIQGYIVNPPPGNPEYKYISSVAFPTPETEIKK
jgi:hypothetical protein